MTTLFGRDPLANPDALIRRVYAYVAYRLGDGPDAEDVTSEVFERALRYRSSYDRSKGEPSTWLLGIARRCTGAALAARADDRRELVAESDGRIRPLDGGSLEDAAVRRLTLGAALSQLGERDQELIALRFGADLTAAQIAQLLDARPNAIEVALHRALARIRSILEDQEAGRAASRARSRRTAAGSPP
jgi:RNA polymerase sigma-70 factor, ECF subfamily